MDYPHVNKMLETARLYATADRIAEWWFERNRHNYSDICKISGGEFCRDGIIVTHFFEYCDYNPSGYEYASELNTPIIIPWEDFWDKIFQNNEEHLMWFYENYTDLFKHQYKLEGKTPEEWYDEVWLKHNSYNS